MVTGNWTDLAVNILRPVYMMMVQQIRNQKVAGDIYVHTIQACNGTKFL